MHDHSKYQFFVRSHLQEIDGAFQKSLVLWKLRMSGIFCGNSHRSKSTFLFLVPWLIFLFTWYISVWSNCQCTRFPTGTEKQTFPFQLLVRPTPFLLWISSSAFFFLTFLFTKNTIDYRFWKQLFIWLVLNVKF